jgi:GNAT superfamily N-acetyltransferase
MPSRLRVQPLTPGRWPDLVKLFGPCRSCAECWCMWWRLPRAAFEAGKGSGNRRGLERYVKAGNVPGLLAYEEGEPVGWIAVEPRRAFSRLERSRLLAPVDDRPVWAITCFFVARAQRGKGLTRTLVEGAARHVRARGAALLEAYPVELSKRTGDGFVYHGAASTFRALGFVEVARRSPTRPIVRLALGGRSAGRGTPGAAPLTSRPASAARGRARGRSTPRSPRRRGSGGPRDR